MLRIDDNDGSSGANRKAYLRSVSWTDRSPTKPIPRPKLNSKARACLPPLQPLAISRPKAEEWPKAGNDDLGVWPNPSTPGVRNEPVKVPWNKSASEPSPREFEFKRDKIAFFEKDCSRIANHIYLGSDTVAKDREILQQNGITHVLNCVGFVCPEYFKGDLVYKTLWLRDSPTEDITSILYDVFDYFEDVREQGGRVFVHCCQGISRSSSLVIAYLMWREGQSFEDALQNVKAARGVTNPNMGFACQLLQCQKRVHAMPASPSSVLRMYRMAPHSPYDPLHLVPKLLSRPGASGLDSRGAFIVHVPTAIYVWVGKNCASVMSDNARVAALQVIRYEKAKVSVLSIREGEETSEFWNALGGERVLSYDCNTADTQEQRPSASSLTDSSCQDVGKRMVKAYELDFAIYQKALFGGVIPPSALFRTGSETCLPAKENGWGRLRQKFANGAMKEFVSSSKMSVDMTQSNHGQDIATETYKGAVSFDSHIDLTPVSSPTRGSPDSFASLAINGLIRMKDTFKEEKNSVPHSDNLLSPPPPRFSPDTFSCFLADNRKFSSLSPSLSSSTSEYSDPFTLSPSSSNWSDLSYLSAQPSPTGMEPTDQYIPKKETSQESPCLICKETSLLPREAFATDYVYRNTCFPCKGTSPSIAERRGSNPPHLMMLPSITDAPQVKANLVKSQSFSLPGTEDDVMRDAECNQFEERCLVNADELMMDADISTSQEELQSRTHEEDDSDISHFSSGDMIGNVSEATSLVLYLWPTMDQVDMDILDLNSGSVYFIFARDVNSGLSKPDVLYVWVGRDRPFEDVQGMACGDGMCKDSNIQWDTVSYNFLLEKGLASKSVVQIVREGAEPEELHSLLQHFSFRRKRTLVTSETREERETC